MRNFSNKYRLIAGIISSLLFLSSSASAYYETHPPYLFKQGPLRHVSDKPLADKDILPFIKKDIDPAYLKPQVYRIDVDGNGTQDFIAFVYPGASMLLNEIHIYLKKPEGGYREISYVEDAGAGIEDIVDINKDGKWEVILTDLCPGEKHNYFSYSVYEIKDYRLVNADKKFKDFPKFVWFTDRNNDKNTTQLTAEERRKHVQKKDKEIAYKDIK